VSDRTLFGSGRVKHPRRMTRGKPRSKLGRRAQTQCPRDRTTRDLGVVRVPAKFPGGTGSLRLYYSVFFREKSTLHQQKSGSTFGWKNRKPVTNGTWPANLPIRCVAESGNLILASVVQRRHTK